MTSLPTVLLVHGSWHGPWCWDLFAPVLEARGFATRRVALPSVGPGPASLKGLPDDAAVVAEAAAAIAGEVVVLGHSYGGAVLAEARFPANVRRLIFLGAFMPDTGRSYPSYLPPGPLPPFIEMRADGSFAVRPEHAVATFYADCPAEVAAWAASRLVVQSQAVLGHVTTQASWRGLPSSYILLTEDFAVPTFLQREFAPQAGEMFVLEGSHSPMLAQPHRLADLVERIVAPVAASA